MLLLSCCVGCVNSRIAADRIVTAPNRNGDPAGNHQMLGLWRQVETNYLTQRIETPIRYTSVSVGPPAANGTTMVTGLPAVG